MSVERACDSDGVQYIIRDLRMREIQQVHGLTVVGEWVWEADFNSLPPPETGWTTGHEMDIDLDAVTA